MSLPVLEVEEEIRKAIRPECGRLLLKAPTGSGKSTTVPGMVADEVRGRVIVVQPRRMAARLLADYVARQRGTSLGDGVGYAVRFDSRYRQDTQIIYLTDGLLQRWLLDDPELKGISAVIFDEFHERRLASDLSLGRVLDLQEGERPDLKLVVMSATLEVGDLQGYLSPCEVVEAGGRLYPVEISHYSTDPNRRSSNNRREELWDRVAKAVRQESGGLGEGDRILVFLPGVYEIRKCEALLQNSDWEVKSLYSALSPAVQQEAIRRDSSKRIILSTNVAETSVTIEGVKLVIDSGLARQSQYDAARGFDSLRVVKISQAAAEQRAGRAGRTGPGRCVRLWSVNDHRARLEFELPEIRRVDLAEAALFLKRLGINDVSDFRWLDAPDTHRRMEAENLLKRLGAVNPDGSLTEDGWEMAGWPMHPRLARLLLAGVEFDCVAEVAFVAATVQGEGVFKRGGKGDKWSDFINDQREEGLDFAGEWHALQAARRAKFHPRDCQALGVLARGAREVSQSFDQIIRLLEKRMMGVKAVHFARHAEGVAQALLVAFGDRLAVRRDAGSAVCHVVGNRRGKLDPKSSVRNAPLFLAAEITEVEGRERNVILSRCAQIREEWLTGIEEKNGVTFDEIQRRVISVKQRVYQGLVLEEKRGGDVDPDLAAGLLAERIVNGELTLKHWDHKVERWIARLQFLSTAMPELELPGFSEGDRETVIGELCEGALTFKEVKARDPWPALNQWLSQPQAEALKAYAPEKITLMNGVNSRVHYKQGEAPWIEEKVQRLYEVKTTPVIANDHRLVVKILAPNQRPWQVTSDLENFWENGFTQMKKDLAGRYPKHDWR